MDQQGSVNGYSAEGFAFSAAAAGRLLYNVLPILAFAPTRHSVDLQPLEGAGMLGLMLAVCPQMTSRRARGKAAR